MPDAASVLIGPGRDGVDANAVLAEVGREIAHAGLQRRLGHAHHVVVRHHLLGAVVGEREQRAAGLHQLLGALRQRGERVAGDQHGLREVLLRRVDVAAVQLGLVGEGDGVHQEIELAPLAAELCKHRIDGGGVADVTGQHQLRSQLTRQRLDALLERIALIGEGESRALRRRGLGDAPGDGAVVGHSHDQAALALHEGAGRNLEASRRSTHSPVPSRI